jgi:general secretion pathway protein H
LPAERGRAPGGFTLIELLVVLAILGMGMALAVPFLGKRPSGAQLVAAASEVRAGLRTARTAAIAEGRPVTFRADASGYWLDRQYHRLADNTGRLRIDTAGYARIAFFPSGESSGGRVVVRAGGSRRDIAVDAVTGRAVLVP